ncbi:MAG: hypothetical protein QXS50_07060 [Candidatus Caldarchaeum sp.]
MDWLQLGVAGGALLTLITIVRIFRGLMGRVISSHEETTDKILHFFGNHMSASVKAQEQVASALRDLADEVAEMRRGGAT